MRVGIVGSHRYPAIRDVLGRVVEAGRHTGFTFVTDSNLSDLWPEQVPVFTDDCEIDLLVTLGGDGTLLRGLRTVRANGTPVLGVNFGHVGFLTTTDSEGLEGAFADVVAGNYTIEERETIDGWVVSANGTPGDAQTALNDIVVHHGHLSKVVQMRVFVDGSELGQYSADGMVVATATGSTAYSLSSGGPILSPEVEALVITPIAAHSLAVRPVVVSGDSEVSIQLQGRVKGEINVSYDGEPGATLKLKETLVMKRADQPVKLIRLEGEGFFARMRQKLQWGDLSDRTRNA